MGTRWDERSRMRMNETCNLPATLKMKKDIYQDKIENTQRNGRM